MKISAKMISSTVYLFIALPILAINNYFLTLATMFVISSFCITEVATVSKAFYKEGTKYPITTLAVVVNALILLALGIQDVQNHIYVIAAFLAVPILLMIFCVLNYDNNSIVRSIFALFFAAVMPCMFYSCVITSTNEYGLFFLAFTFFGTWMSDTSAQFSGTLFGKHKLSPKLSPNKTIEGSIGSLICTALLFLFGASVAVMFGYAETANLQLAFLLGLLVSLAGQVGDLFASGIKRTFRVKDFSNLIPGHGGMYDRFDAFMFVAPTVLIFTSIFNIF